ncbi:DUF6440 family protein, partial [Intestinimonas butyriciproducens]
HGGDPREIWKGDDTMFGEKKENRFVKLSIEGVKDVACMQVVVDTWTGIQYLFAESFGNAGGLTALLDEDGKPLICEEYRRKKE